MSEPCRAAFSASYTVLSATGDGDVVFCVVFAAEVAVVVGFELLVDFEVAVIFVVVVDFEVAAGFEFEVVFDVVLVVEGAGEFEAAVAFEVVFCFEEAVVSDAVLALGAVVVAEAPVVVSVVESDSSPLDEASEAVDCVSAVVCLLSEISEESEDISLCELSGADDAYDELSEHPQEAVSMAAQRMPQIIFFFINTSYFYKGLSCFQ